MNRLQSIVASVCLVLGLQVNALAQESGGAVPSIGIGIGVPASPSVSAEPSGRSGQDLAVPNDAYRAGGSVPTAPATTAAAAEGRRGPVLIKGNDQVVKLPPSRTLVSADEAGVGLRFEQAPVTEVIHTVFGNILKLDYAIVPPLTGEITLHTQGDRKSVV